MNVGMPLNTTWKTNDKRRGALRRDVDKTPHFAQETFGITLHAALGNRPLRRRQKTPYLAQVSLGMLWDTTLENRHRASQCRHKNHIWHK
jgi:hypothetical protein